MHWQEEIKAVCMQNDLSMNSNKFSRISQSKLELQHTVSATFPSLPVWFIWLKASFSFFLSIGCFRFLCKCVPVLTFLDLTIIFEIGVFLFDFFRVGFKLGSVRISDGMNKKKVKIPRHFPLHTLILVRILRPSRRVPHPLRRRHPHLQKTSPKHHLEQTLSDLCLFRS